MAKKYNSKQNTKTDGEQKTNGIAAMFDRLIEYAKVIESSDWKMGWNSTKNSWSGMPQNISGREYTGGNSFYLMFATMANNYSMPVYATFNQINKLNQHLMDDKGRIPKDKWDQAVHVKKGEASEYAIFSTVQYKNPDEPKEKPLTREQYLQLPTEEREKYEEKWINYAHAIFNVDQTNMKEVRPELYEKLKEKMGINERQNFLQDTKGMYAEPAIDYILQNQTWRCPVNFTAESREAFYSPSKDAITIPMKEQFNIPYEEKDLEKEIKKYVTPALTMKTAIENFSDADRNLDNLKANKDNTEYKTELRATLMLENTFGKQLNILRQDGQSLNDYAKQIADAIESNRENIIDIKNQEAKITGGKDFYATFIHEGAHSMSKELNIDLNPSHDKKGYAREELRAESSAAIIAATMGYGNAIIFNSAAYIRGWNETASVGEKTKQMKQLQADINSTVKRMGEMIDDAAIKAGVQPIFNKSLTEKASDKIDQAQQTSQTADLKVSQQATVEPEQKTQAPAELQSSNPSQHAKSPDQKAQGSDVTDSKDFNNLKAPTDSIAIDNDQNAQKTPETQATEVADTPMTYTLLLEKMMEKAKVHTLGLPDGVKIDYDNGVLTVDKYKEGVKHADFASLPKNEQDALGWSATEIILEGLQNHLKRLAEKTTIDIIVDRPNGDSISLNHGNLDETYNQLSKLEKIGVLNTFASFAEDEAEELFDKAVKNTEDNKIYLEPNNWIQKEEDGSLSIVLVKDNETKKESLNDLNGLTQWSIVSFAVENAQKLEQTKEKEYIAYPEQQTSPTDKVAESIPGDLQSRVEKSPEQQSSISYDSNMAEDSNMSDRLNQKQKLEAIGYPYKGYNKEDGSYDIPTVNESLYWRYAAGIITLKDAAREFTKNGWTNFVDEDYTLKQFEKINQKWHKLSDDLLPLSANQETITNKQIEDFKKATGIQLEVRDGKPYYDGNLDLAGSKIKRLPDNLTVNGRLELNNTPIEKLPKNLTVNGLLNLIKSDIKELPDNLTVKGSLWLEKTNIERLPENMSVKGGLWLEKTNIEKLPENLTVGTDLNLSNTPIKELPKGLTVGNDLVLSDTPIKELPDNLTVGGNLDLTNTPIRELPDNISIGKSLYLENTQIERLPDNLTVNGMLDLTNTPIKELPENLTVKGFLELSDSKIERLSENLTVKGDLNLRNTPIKELPDNLTVGLCLDLSNTPIKELPKNLTVGWILDLTNTAVTELPADLKVKDDIYMNNRKIPAIPDNISPDGYIDLQKAGAPIQQNEEFTLWNKLSALLMDTSEDIHFKAKKDEILVLETDEDMGLSDLEKNHLSEVWQHPSEGIITFKMEGSNQEFDLSDYPEFIPQIYNHVADDTMEMISVKQQLEDKLIALSQLAEQTPKDRQSDIVFVREFDPDKMSNIYTAYGKDADRLAEKISSSAVAMRPEIEGQRYPNVTINSGNIDAVRADLMMNNIHPVIIDLEGNRIHNDKTLDYTKEERKAFLDSLKPEEIHQQRMTDTISKEETLTPSEYAILWMTSIVENTPKDRPSDIIFVKDFDLANSNSPIYTAYGKDADRLAEKISSSAVAMRPEIEGKRYPYADISGSRIDAVRADLMMNNVHPVIIDIEGNRITNDKTLDYTKEERKAFLDSLKPEAQQLKNIAETLQRMGNPDKITVPQVYERPSARPELLIPQRFGYQEIALMEIKKAKDGSYKAGNSEDGYYPIAKMDTNNLFNVEKALNNAEKLLPQNLVKELLQQVQSGKAEISRANADGRYTATINDPEKYGGAYERGFKQFSFGSDLKNEILLHNDWKNFVTPIKVEPAIVQQLVNYAETKLGITKSLAQDSNQKAQLNAEANNGQKALKIEDFLLRNVGGDWKLSAKVNDKQMREITIPHNDVVDFKHGRMSQQDLITKSYGDSLNQKQEQNQGRSRHR